MINISGILKNADGLVEAETIYIKDIANKAKRGTTKDLVNGFFDSLRVSADERQGYVLNRLKKNVTLDIDADALKSRVDNFTKINENNIDKMNALTKMRNHLESGNIESAIEEAGIVDSYIAGNDNMKFTNFLKQANNKMLAGKEAITQNFSASSDPDTWLKMQYKKKVFDESSVSNAMRKSGMFEEENLTSASDSIVDHYFSPKDYFLSNDPVKRRNRIATAAVGYGVGAMAVRKLQGGSLTRNEYGDMDITGIPIL